MLGYNLKKSVATIDSDTFKYEIFNSLSECAKKLNTSAKAVSKVANDKKFYSHKGKTIVFYVDDNQLKNDISIFKEKRNILNNRKNDLPETRICSVYKKELPLNNEFFHKGRLSIYKKDSFKRLCKKCTIGKHVIYYNKNKKIRNENFEKKAEYVLKMYRKLDKNKNEFNLTLDWVKENLIKPCIYCGFKSNGFDRKNNSIGHTIDNCVPCCTECNNGRMNNFTHEEFFIIGEAIRQIKIKRQENDRT